MPISEASIEIISPVIESYLESLLPSHHPILREMEAEADHFDIIFNDIDKDAYPDIPPKALPRLRTGGMLIADNALWSGRVAEPPADSWTAGVQAYNRMVASDTSLITLKED